MHMLWRLEPHVEAEWDTVFGYPLVPSSCTPLLFCVYGGYAWRVPCKPRSDELGV